MRELEILTPKTSIRVCLRQSQCQVQGLWTWLLDWSDHMRRAWILKNIPKMMMGRENYSLKYVNEKIKSGSVERGGGGRGYLNIIWKFWKRGKVIVLFVLWIFFFLSFFFLSFFRPDATLTKLGANCSPIESVRFLVNLKFDIVSTTMEGIFYWSDLNLILINLCRVDTALKVCN